MVEGAKSVFYDIADSPDEAANLTARSALMMAIEQRIRANGWTQAQAARTLGVQQPRVSDLMNGKIDKFSLDALVKMLPAVGLAVKVVPQAQPKPGPAPSVGRGRPSKAVKRVAELPRPRVRRVAAAAKGSKLGMVAKAGAKGSLRSRKKK